MRVKESIILLTLSLLMAPGLSARDATGVQDATGVRDATRSQDTARFDFLYEKDHFGSEALLDLRGLNEAVAGTHGFVQLSDDGNSFVFEDGTPIRWWPVNGGDLAKANRLDDEELAYFARFLAKLGVNMIRYHGSINPPGKGTGIMEVDTAEVRAIWRLVAFMKKEGIYTTVSPFWPHNGHMGGWVPEEWGIEGYFGKDELWSVMYFSDTLKNAYKEWVRYLYTEPNPHTGIPLSQDPALALIQIQNEDGLFFWTFQNIKPELKNRISLLFAQWLEERYGSLDKAYEAWNGLRIEGDIPAGESGTGALPGLYLSWHMTQDLQGDEALRMADQMAFMTDWQHDFYAEITAWYKEDLGCHQLVNANNWKTAHAGRLLDAERYTYTAADVVAVNRYNTPGHMGENNGWRIDPGHFYVGASVLHKPDKFPLNIKQVEGHPTIITESGWNTPHRYMSEGSFLVAAYQGLNGLDGFYWFNPSAPAYDEFPYFGFTKDEQGRHAMQRWTCSVPGMMGMFPAGALVHRMGYIRQAEPVVEEKRSLEEIYQRQLPLITEEMGFDPNRDQEFAPLTAGKSGSEQAMLSPLTYLTGPVMVDYGENKGRNRISKKLDALVDEEAGVVSSSTGELQWNYLEGWAVMDAPCAQGACGFLDQQRRFQLEDVIIESDNPYAAVSVVSMDGLPLGESTRILVQVGTTYQPTGWKEEPASFSSRDGEMEGFRILDTGRMPWQGEPARVRITLKNNSQIKSAVALSTSGYPEKLLPLEQLDEGLSIRVPADCIYLVLTGQ